MIFEKINNDKKNKEDLNEPKFYRWISLYKNNKDIKKLILEDNVFQIEIDNNKNIIKVIYCLKNKFNYDFQNKIIRFENLDEAYKIRENLQNDINKNILNSNYCKNIFKKEKIFIMND